METEYSRKIYSYQDKAQLSASPLRLTSTDLQRGYAAYGADSFGSVVEDFVIQGTNLTADVYNQWTGEIGEGEYVWDVFTQKHYRGNEYLSIINYDQTYKRIVGEQYQRIKELEKAHDNVYLTETQHHMKSMSGQFELESGDTRRLTMFNTGNNSYGAINEGLGKVEDTQGLGIAIRSEFDRYVRDPIQNMLSPTSNRKHHLQQSNLSIVISDPAIQSELQGIRQSIATKGLAYSTEHFLMGGPGTDSTSEIISDLERAKTAIDIMSPYMDKPEVIDALIEAQRRGVNVRVISSNPMSRVPTATGGGTGHTIALARLQASGISVYTPKVYQAFLPHAKGYQVDKLVGRVGSHNITGAAHTRSFDGFFKGDEYLAHFVVDNFDTLIDGGFVHDTGATVNNKGFKSLPKGALDYARAEIGLFSQGLENPEFVSLGLDTGEHRDHLLLPSRAGSSYHFGVALHNQLMRQAGHHHMILGERREGIATQMYKLSSQIVGKSPASESGLYWAARYDQGLYAQGAGNWMNEHVFMPMGWGRVYKDEVGAIPSFLGMIGKAFDTGYLYYSSIAPDYATLGQDYNENAVGYNMLAGGQAGMFERMFEGTAFNVMQAAAAVSLYVTVGQPLALMQAEFIKDRFQDAIKASFGGGIPGTSLGRQFDVIAANKLFGNLEPYMRPGDISGHGIKEAVMRKAAQVESDRAFYSIANDNLGFLHYQQYIARGRAGYLLERTMKPILVDMINPHTPGSVGNDIFVEKVDSLIKAIRDPVDISFKLVTPYTSKDGSKIRDLRLAIQTFEADWKAIGNYTNIEGLEKNIISLQAQAASGANVSSDIARAQSELESRKAVRNSQRSIIRRRLDSVVSDTTITLKNIGADRSENIARKLQDVLQEVPLNPFRWGIFGGHRGSDYMRVGQLFSFYEMTQHARKVLVGRGSFSRLIERARVIDGHKLGTQGLIASSSSRELRKSISDQIRRTAMTWNNIGKMGMGYFWDAITTELKSTDGGTRRVLFDIQARDDMWGAIRQRDIKSTIRNARQWLMPVSEIGQVTHTMRAAESAMLKNGAVQFDEIGGLISVSADAKGSHLHFLNAVGEYQDEIARHSITADDLYRVGQASADFRGEKLMAGFRKGSHGVIENSLRLRQRSLGLLAAGTMFGALLLNNVFQSNKGTSLWTQFMMSTVAAKEDKSLSVDFSGNRLLPTEVVADQFGLSMLTVNTAYEVAAGVGFLTMGMYFARNSSYQGFQAYDMSDEIIEDVNKRQFRKFQRQQFAAKDKFYFFQKAVDQADAQRPSNDIDKQITRKANGEIDPGRPRALQEFDAAKNIDYDRMFVYTLDSDDVIAMKSAGTYDEAAEFIFNRKKGAGITLHKVLKETGDGSFARSYRIKSMMQTFSGKSAVQTFMYASVLMLASQSLRSSLAATLDKNRETAGAADPLVAGAVAGLGVGLFSRNIVLGITAGLFGSAVMSGINKWAGFRIMPLGGVGKKLDMANAQMNATLLNYSQSVVALGEEAGELNLYAAFYAKEMARQRSIFESTKGRYVQSIARQVPLPFIQLAFVERKRGFGFDGSGRMTFESEFVEKNYAVAIQAAPITGFSFSVGLPVKYNRNSGVMGWSYDDQGDVNILDIVMGTARFSAVQSLTLGTAIFATGGMGRLLQQSASPKFKMLSPLGDTLVDIGKNLSFLDVMGKGVSKFLNEFIVSNALQIAKHVPTTVMAMGTRLADKTSNTAVRKAFSHLEEGKALGIPEVDKKVAQVSGKFFGRMSSGVMRNFKSLLIGGVIGYTALQFVYQGYLQQINERQDEQPPMVNLAVSVGGFTAGATTYYGMGKIGLRIGDYLDTRTNLQMIKYRSKTLPMLRKFRAYRGFEKIAGGGSGKLRSFMKTGAGSYTRSLGLALAVTYLMTNQDFGLTVSMDRSYKMNEKGDPVIDPITGDVLYERLPAHQMLVMGTTGAMFAGVMSLFGGLGRSNEQTLYRYAQILVDKHGLGANYQQYLGEAHKDLVRSTQGPRGWINKLTSFVQDVGVEDDAKQIIRTMNNQFRNIDDIQHAKVYTNQLSDYVLKQVDDLGLTAVEKRAAINDLSTNKGFKAIQKMRGQMTMGQINTLEGFDVDAYRGVGDAQIDVMRQEVGNVAVRIKSISKLIPGAKPLNKIVSARLFSKRTARGLTALFVARIAFNTLTTQGGSDYSYLDNLLRGFDSHGKFRLSGPHKNLDPRSALGDSLRLFLGVDRYDPKMIESHIFGRPVGKFIQSQKNLMASRKDIKHLERSFSNFRDMMIFDDPNAFMSIMSMGGVTFRPGDKGPRINFYFQLQNSGQDISTSVYSMSSAFSFHAMKAGAIEMNLITEATMKGLTSKYNQPQALAVLGHKLLNVTSMLHPIKSKQRRRVSSIPSDTLHVIQKDSLQSMIVKDRERAMANLSWQPVPSLAKRQFDADIYSKGKAMNRILQAVVSNTIQLETADGKGVRELTPGSRNKLIQFLVRSKKLTGNDWGLTNITNVLIYSHKRRSKGVKAQGFDFSTETVWMDKMSMAAIDYDYELAPMSAITRGVDFFRQYIAEPLKPLPVINTLIYNPLLQTGAMIGMTYLAVGISVTGMKAMQVAEDLHEINRRAAATFDDSFLDSKFKNNRYKLASTPTAVRGTSQGMAQKVIIAKGERRYMFSEVIDETAALHKAGKYKGGDPVNSLITALDRVEAELDKVFTHTLDLQGRKALEGTEYVARSLFDLVDNTRGSTFVNYIMKELSMEEGVVGLRKSVKMVEFVKVIEDRLWEQIEHAAKTFVSNDVLLQKIPVDGAEYHLINLLDPDFKPSGDVLFDEKEATRRLDDLTKMWTSHSAKDELGKALRESINDVEAGIKGGKSIDLEDATQRLSSKFNGGAVDDQLDVIIKQTLNRFSDSSHIQGLRVTLGGLLRAEDMGSLNFAQRQVYKMAGVISNFEIPNAGKQTAQVATKTLGSSSSAFKASALKTSAWNSLGQGFKAFGLAMDLAWAFDTYGAFANLGAAYTNPYSTQLDIDMQEREVGMIAMNTAFGLTLGFLGFKYILGGLMGAAVTAGWVAIPVIAAIGVGAYAFRKQLGGLWDYTKQQAKSRNVGKHFNNMMWAGGDFIGSALGAPSRVAYHLTGSERAAAGAAGAVGGASAGFITGLGAMTFLTTGAAALTAATGTAVASIPFWPVILGAVAVGAVAGGILMFTAPDKVSDFTSNVRRALFNLHPMFGPWLATQPYEMLMMQSRFRKNFTSSPFDFGWARQVTKQKHRERLAAAKDYTGGALASQSLDNYIFGDSGPTSAFKEFVAAQSWSIAKPRSAVDSFTYNELKIREQIVSHSTFGKAAWESAVGYTGQEKRIHAREQQYKKKKLERFLKAERDAQTRTSAQAHHINTQSTVDAFALTKIEVEDVALISALCKTICSAELATTDATTEVIATLPNIQTQATDKSVQHALEVAQQNTGKNLRQLDNVRVSIVQDQTSSYFKVDKETSIANVLFAPTISDMQSHEGIEINHLLTTQALDPAMLNAQGS